jgi:hypothetical protein
MMHGFLLWKKSLRLAGKFDNCSAQQRSRNGKPEGRRRSLRQKNLQTEKWGQRDFSVCIFFV